MSKILKQVQIPENLANYIQRLNYEVEGYKSIIATIIRGQGEFSYNKDIYDYHIERFKEVNAAFNIAMSEIIDIYATEFPDKSILSAKLDFSTCMVYITETQRKGVNLCNCEKD
jgi:hypothetical protein